MWKTFRQPLAWLPIAASVTMFVTIVLVLAIQGVVYHEDEGAMAHIFQFWLMCEFLAMFFFAASNLGRITKQVLVILGFQFIMFSLPLGIVFYLGL